MRIITVPHPTLRQVAHEITQVDKKLVQLTRELGSTLSQTQNPRGVGLAAPQIDVPKRMFATFLNFDQSENDEALPTLAVYINPEIVTHSDQLTLGPDKKHPTLEGCLSIPGLYGPVPRWTEITLSYQELVEEKLIDRTQTFDNFAARVVQHEVDHLNGILFTDYSLQYDLPVYQENKKTDTLDEIDPKALEGL